MLDLPWKWFMAKLSCEQMYPTKKARDIADSVVDGMPLDATMLSYIVAWEEAYLKAGGVVNT